MEDERSKQLKAVRDAVWNLTASPLYEYRVTNNSFPVIGQGNHFAELMFVGEAPGKYEAMYARPFIGKAGKFLDTLLASIGLEREQIYITNIVKDRPPDNRDPTLEEIQLYSPFLDEQIAIIQPRVIVTLGRFSMEYILYRYHRPEYQQNITALHGKVIEATAPHGEIHIAVQYHPALALWKPENRPTLMQDFQVLRQFIE